MKKTGFALASALAASAAIAVTTNTFYVGAGQWAEGILVTGSLDDFWTEFASFGYSDLRDILFASDDSGETKSKTYKPEIRPAVIVR